MAGLNPGAPVNVRRCRTPSPQVWAAAVSVPGPLSARQLYVNGARANRSSIYFNQASHVTVHASGILVADRGIAGWLDNPPRSPVELIWTGGCKAHAPHCAPGEHSYREARCSVTAVTEVSEHLFNISIAQPCWGNARTSGCSTPSAVANLKSLVLGVGPLNYSSGTSNPGDFFHDVDAGEVLYIPREGEDMSVADVVLPVLETVVAGSGVAAVTFTGIGFEHGAWALSSGPHGYVDDQAGTHVLGATADCAKNWSGPACPLVPIPGNVRFEHSTDIAFVACSFAHFGATALHLDVGTQGATVSRCSFSDVSGSAVQIGAFSDFDQADPAKQTAGNTLADSRVTGLPVEYHGAATVAAFITKNTTVAHNDIWDTPYTGLSVGWGWHSAVGNDSYACCVDVAGNSFARTVQLLFDGGSVYTLGSTPHSRIRQNHIHHQRDFLAALYHDDGSAGWSDTANVIHSLGPNQKARSAAGPCKESMAWCSMWTAFDHDIKVMGNFVDHDCETNAGTRTTISGTVVLNGTSPAGWPKQATDIVAAAGPRAA